MKLAVVNESTTLVIVAALNSVITTVIVDFAQNVIFCNSDTTMRNAAVFTQQLIAIRAVPLGKVVFITICAYDLCLFVGLCALFSTVTVLLCI